MSTQHIQPGSAECKSEASATHRWFAVSREILDHEVVGASVKTPPPYRRSHPAWAPLAVWLWMIGEAAHQDYKRTLQAQTILLRRGQLVVSERYLADKANWGRKAAKVFLDRLAHFEMVRLSTTSPTPQQPDLFGTHRLICKTPKRGPSKGPGKGPGLTVVTICNYDKYQLCTAKQGPGKGPSEGPARGQTLQLKKEKESGSASDFPDDRRVSFDGGRLTLFGELRSFWLAEFDGDDKALDLGLLQAAGFVQPNSSRPLEAQVSAQLARQRADQRTREKNYRNAAEAGRTVKGAAHSSAPMSQKKARAIASMRNIEEALR